MRAAASAPERMKSGRLPDSFGSLEIKAVWVRLALQSFACLALLFVSQLLAPAQTDKQAWVQRFNETASSDDVPETMVVDVHGNVIVAGYSDEGISRQDILLVKYSGDGFPLWTNRFKGPGNSLDHANGLAVDGSANVFVTGYIVNDTINLGVTLAYSSGGVPLWTNMVPGVTFTSIALDRQGGVFVTGYNAFSPFYTDDSSDYVTVAYSNAGVPRWTNRYDGPGHLRDGANALAVGSSGNVFVTGTSEHLSGSYEFATLCYSASGVPLWTNRFGGNNSYAAYVAVDSSDRAIVTGNSQGQLTTIAYSALGVPIWTNMNGSFPYLRGLVIGTNDTAFLTGYGDVSASARTIAISNQGTLLWTNGLRIEGSTESYATGLTLANNGNVVITGTFVYSNDLEGIFTAAYSDGGAKLWTNKYEISGVTSRSVAIAADNSGKVFVTGLSIDLLYSSDWSTIAYSNSGIPLWTNRYNGLGNNQDFPYGIATDSGGNVFVTGLAQSPDSIYAQRLTIAYSSRGVPMWTNRFDAPLLLAVWFENPNCTVATEINGGNVYVTGVAYGTNESFDYVTIAYNRATGAALWTNRYDGPGNGRDTPAALAVDRNGNVFVTGSSAGAFATVAYSRSGTLLWTNHYQGLGYLAQATAVAVDEGDKVFVTGNFGVVQNNAAVWTYLTTIACSINDGHVLWTNNLPILDQPEGGALPGYPVSSMAVGAHGAVFVTGTTALGGGAQKYITIGYSNNGTPLWTNRYSGLTGFDDRATAVAIDNKENVFVTRQSGDVYNGYEFATIAYSATGASLWTNRYRGQFGEDSFAVAVMPDGIGNVFVTGNVGSDVATIAYSGSGLPLWTNRYNGPFNRVDRVINNHSMVVSGPGTVLVGCISDQDSAFSSGADYGVIKYISDFTLDISSPPVGRVSIAGTMTAFSVRAQGTPPLTYQWRRNGTNLVNGGSVSGVTTSNLTLNTVSTNDSANYTVVVANPAGSVTSVVAVLSVVQASTPQVLLNGVAYPANVVVTPNSAPFTAALLGGFPGGDLIYTTDGSDPIVGELYEGPFQVSPPFSIRVLAVSSDFLMFSEAAPVNSLVVTTPGGGMITSYPQRDVVTGGPVVRLTAEPVAGWSFINWSGDASGASRTISVAVDDPKSVQAVFGTPLNATINGGGQISTTPGGPLYAFGAKVRLTGLPNSGSYFTRWLGAVRGTNNPVDLVVTNASPSLLAIFSLLPTNTFALTVSITGEGSVSRTPSRNFYTNGAVVTLTALPGALQNFTAWSGDVASLSNSISVTMNANKFITATFDTVTPSPVPVFFLAAPTYSISETGASVTVTVLKRLNSPGGTVNYATTNGTALSPGDYSAMSGALTFSSNEVSKTVSISIVDNAGYVGTRQFSFGLSLADTNSALGTPSNAIVTIIEDDLPVTTNSLLTRVAPGPLPASTSALAVELHPAGVGQWALEQESVWRDSGEVLTGLAGGNYALKFRRVAGHAQPEKVLVQVDAAQTNYYIFGYAPITSPPAYGSVQVLIQPGEVANNVNALLKGRWRLRGDTNWYDSGAVLTGVLAGTNVVEFSGALSYVTPQAREVALGAGQISVVSAAYATYGFSGDGATPRTFDEATNTALGMGYVGQVLSEAGFGSGFAVKPRVVLTAAHVVFNDQAFSFVSPPQWLFQRHEGTHEPPPQTARGFYVLSGYASARTNDSPGFSSLLAHSLDVAALYFNEDAGRGGSSGYLVSEAPPAGTEWLMQLTAPGQSKILMGYPVETPDQALIPGRLYSTPVLSGPVGFGREFERVFSTTDLHGYPGMSGGPLCVPFTNGVYYPAAVYVGGAGQKTAVRAIDGAVANMIEQAEKTAYSGDNHTGGGVILINPIATPGTFSTGYVRVALGPPAAVSAGGAWRVPERNIPYTSDPNVRIPLSSGAFTIEFKPLAGWQSPSNQPSAVNANQVIILPENYEELPSRLSLLVNGRLSLSGAQGLVYRIESATNLGPTGWTTLTNVTFTTTNITNINVSVPGGAGRRFFRGIRP